MQHWRISRPGGPEVLSLAETQDPEPGPEEVLVRVQAVGVNRADLLQRRGLYPPPPGFDPAVPGLEYAGVVERAGVRTRLRRVGDRVMGLVGGSAYAELVVVHERETLSVPEPLSAEAAAAIPEAFLTAYRALYLVAGLQAGELCVIRAVTSSVGVAAVQLVRALGGRSLGSSRAAARLERVKPLGLDYGHVENAGDLAQAVRAVNGGEGAAVVLDLLGGGHLAENLAALRDEGSMVLIGLLTGRQDRIDLGDLLMRRLCIRSMTMRSLPLEDKIALVRRFDSTLLPLFRLQRLKPVVGTVLSFAQAPEAHRLMESGAYADKIVLRL